MFVQLSFRCHIFLFLQEPTHLLIVEVHRLQGFEIVDFAYDASFGMGKLLANLTHLQYNLIVAFDIGLVL